MKDPDLRALSVRCPLCWAAPQKLCFSPNAPDRKVLQHTVHIARLDAYERLQKEPS